MEQELPIQQQGTVFPAIFFENSECRYKRCTVSPSLIFVQCWNGLIGENSIEQIHRSYHQKLEGILSRETIDAENKAFWLKVRDVIKATFDDEQYKKWIKQITTASKYELNEPAKVLEGIIVKCEIPETQKNMVFDYFSKQGDATQFGAIQALTYYAHTQEDVEREVSIERVANTLLQMDGQKFEKSLVTFSAKDIVEAVTE